MYLILLIILYLSNSYKWKIRIIQFTYELKMTTCIPIIINSVDFDC